MTSISQKEVIARINEIQPVALGINLGTNIGLSLLTLGAFCWLRPKNGVIYARKYKSSPQEKRAPKLEEGYFSWMGPVWNCPDGVLVDKIGLDAVVFIRFIRMCRNIFMVMAIVGCCALIPVNVIATMRAQPDGKAPTDKISMLSMADITDPQWLWAHVGGTWFFSLVMYFSLYHGYKTFVTFKKQYYKSEAYQEDMASRTIMLAGLPSSLQTDDKLLKFMNDMGLNEKPVQALVGRKVDKLPELMDKHKTMVKALEKVVAKHYADPNRLPSKRPTVRIGGICGSKVDAIDYYSQQIEELTDQIEQTRTQVSKSQPTNYGFVSYGTIHAAHRVAKELSNIISLRKRSKMLDPPEVFLSPVPKDIIWFNVSNPKQLRKTRKLIVNGAFMVASLLFFIPMGLLMAFAKLDRIIGLFPSTQEYFETHKFVASMAQSLLPVLVMDLLLLVVRKFIVFLAWFQGNITKSSTDRSTLAKFFLFFTLNNLIVPAIVGTILGFMGQIKLVLLNFSFSSETWTAIKMFTTGEDNVIDLVSKNVVDTSLFWVNYISLRNFGVLLDLSQLVSLVLYWAKTTVTPRESKAMNKPDVFDFPVFFSAHIFLLTVALLYSVVAPLVLFFAFVYFSLASLVYKYQLMYVFRTRVETGGRLFRVVYNRLLAAIILFQIIMLGILNLKGAHKHSLAVLPLPILTILFKIFLAKTFDPKIDYYDYGSAHEERHLFKNKAKGNALLLTFENPVLKSKVVAALVPDAAKKVLSNKILRGEQGSKEEQTKGGRLGHGKHPSYGKNSPSQRDNSVNRMDEMESYEMGHVRNGSKGNKEKFQVLGSDKNESNNRYEPHRSLSPQRQQRSNYQSQQQQQHVLEVDDHVDDYYDDQRESLTKAAAQRYDDTYSTSQPSSDKVYGAQDMTSFVAGRYRADRTVDPYSYSSNNKGGNSGNGASSGASKPSYMELAKMHQTDSYKNTGKAMQYEDKKALHLPPINFQLPKIQSTSTRGQHQSRKNDHQTPPHEGGAELDIYDQHSEEHMSTPTTPTTPKPSRMPLPQQSSHTSSNPSARKGYKDTSALQHSSSSPSLVQSTKKYGNEHSNDTDLSYSSPNVKSMARAFTSGGVQKPKNTYNDNIVSSTRGRNNDYTTQNY
ncbi:hypothetical protein BGX27_002953 [Mortierella sp. AM989]|nr:hypothetical protein BGX27_002953 [Mortierella sp. AM989]